uniref:Uncharacterized protein n=1 Tax=Trypanosoma congolense (strain IL3000) TaxID=1068625 RepID=G0UQ60_TRYCI|nr:hypothetical protein, unlikely [Trypanosoma congolense IL3000]
MSDSHLPRTHSSLLYAFLLLSALRPGGNEVHAPFRSECDSPLSSWRVPLTCLAIRVVLIPFLSLRQNDMRYYIFFSHLPYFFSCRLSSVLFSFLVLLLYSSANEVGSATNVVCIFFKPVTICWLFPFRV